jgi:raffinose/stachyose/melibiose transport system permease protein
MIKKRHIDRIDPVCYVVVLPLAVLFFLFHTYPFLNGVFYSLTNWKGYGKWDFTGLRNYLQIFKDPNVISSYLFTFKFAISATILVNIISLLLACSLNANIAFKNFLKAVYFLPYMLGTLIISYVFRFIFANILPSWMNALGFNTMAVNILGTSHAWWGILFVTVWQSLAFNTLIYIAGLQTIDKELYEAAALDGAHGLKEFFSITFPMLAPFFTINMILCAKNFLMAFDQIIGLTNGGPGTTTTTISVLIYKRGFQGGQFAYQSADAVMLFIIVILISVLQLNVLEKRERKYE